MTQPPPKNKPKKDPTVTTDSNNAEINPVLTEITAKLRQAYQNTVDEELPPEIARTLALIRQTKKQ